MVETNERIVLGNNTFPAQLEVDSSTVSETSIFSELICECIDKVDHFLVASCCNRDRTELKLRPISEDYFISGSTRVVQLNDKLLLSRDFLISVVLENSCHSEFVILCDDDVRGQVKMHTFDCPISP